jgi:hypothetical protein
MSDDISRETSHRDRIARQKPALLIFASTRRRAACERAASSILNHPVFRKENGRGFAFPTPALGLTDHGIEESHAPAPIDSNTNDALVLAIANRQHRIDSLPMHRRGRRDAMTFELSSGKVGEQRLTADACRLSVQARDRGNQREHDDRAPHVRCSRNSSIVMMSPGPMQRIQNWARIK